jgi:hypothetical protein
VTRRPAGLRLVAAAFTAGVALFAGAGGAAGSTAAAGDTTAPGSSAVTVSGTGPFSSLKVTVSQTTGLIDQVVNLSWTGGTPTDDATSFRDNYLQIMQCWGDDPSGPQREQCEFGSFSGDPRGPQQQPTRQVYSVGAVDPLETYLPTATDPSPHVPFRSVTGVTVPGGQLGQFFDQQSTNEIPFARTSADGTGQVAFETLTAQEAPGLGCGTPITASDGSTSARPCWLVVVPRGDTEVNGQPASANVTRALITSPLSATNWAHRIVIPLHFQQLGQLCPIGSPEAPTGGQEAVEEAVSRWQPALCTEAGTVYGYSEVSDDSARRRLVSSDPGLDFVISPVPSGQVPHGMSLLYAPVTISAGVIAFNVDVRTNGNETPEQLATEGRPITEMNLTPRVVAKLISQSYRLSAPPFDPAVTNSPDDVFDDPDFLADNPADAGLFETAADVLMPFPLSDVTKEVWSWINADPSARAFLDGTADPWGMTVNPAYKGITDASVPSNFPKSDGYCQTAGLPAPDQPQVCTLDARPYANDMHDAARSASRGDTLARSTWDPTALPPAFKKSPPQVTGNQSVMAFTDAATADRYSLPVAKLRNAAGVFVAPDAAGLLAGVAAMIPSGVPGVLAPNPATTSPAAYPLTAVTYAATAPQALTAAERADYATLLKYAATTGQEPGLDIGNLPFGYVPLPADMASETQTIATELKDGTYPIATPTTAAPATTSAPVQGVSSTASSTPATSPSTSPKAKPTPNKTPAPTSSASRSPSPSATGSSTPAATPTGITSQPTFPLSLGGGPSLNTVAALTTTSPAALSGSPGVRSGTPQPTLAAAPVSSVAAAPSQSAAATEPTRVIAATTASVSAGAGKYVVLSVFTFGGIAAVGGPTLIRLSSRRSR